MARFKTYVKELGQHNQVPFCAKRAAGGIRRMQRDIGPQGAPTDDEHSVCSTHTHCHTPAARMRPCASCHSACTFWPPRASVQCSAVDAHMHSRSSVATQTQHQRHQCDERAVDGGHSTRSCALFAYHILRKLRTVREFATKISVTFNMAPRTPASVERVGCRTRGGALVRRLPAGT
jgi:hypothetical protein